MALLGLRISLLFWTFLVCANSTTYRRVKEMNIKENISMFQLPILEVVFFGNEDVIVTSDEAPIVRPTEASTSSDA